MASTLEQQRLANISKNKELLRKLNIHTLTASIKREAEAKKEHNKSKRKPKVEKNIEPQRRSRRLQGIKIEDTEEFQKAFKIAELEKAENEKLEKLKSMKLPGDVSLLEALREQDASVEDSQLLRKFSGLSDAFSAGDFYEVISKRTTDDKSTNNLRSQFSSLNLYDKFAINEIQITDDRVNTIIFHPSTEKIVVAGDIQGNLGVWRPLADSEDPDITQFNLHGKHIAKVQFAPWELSKLYSASYDNSIRVTDLTTFRSTEVLGLVDSYGNDCGISDIQLGDSNSQTVFFTTLTGQFASFDVRSKPNMSNVSLYRLSDKKIGGFSVNPSSYHEIATGSLDRTLKIWDLRNSETASWSEKFTEETSLKCFCHLDSRLSVSSADWNTSGDIVCNGYANTIDIINKKQLQTKSDVSLTPNHTIKHNCRTGKWVTILKSRWQTNPKDGYEKFVIGNMQKYFDVYTSNGIQIAHLGDKSMTAVPAACNLHPTENWLVGGTASGKCVLFVK